MNTPFNQDMITGVAQTADRNTLGRMIASPALPNEQPVAMAEMQRRQYLDRAAPLNTPAPAQGQAPNPMGAQQIGQPPAPPVGSQGIANIRSPVTGLTGMKSGGIVPHEGFSNNKAELIALVQNEMKRRESNAQGGLGAGVKHFAAGSSVQDFADLSLAQRKKGTPDTKLRDAALLAAGLPTGDMGFATFMPANITPSPPVFSELNFPPPSAPSAVASSPDAIANAGAPASADSGIGQRGVQLGSNPKTRMDFTGGFAPTADQIETMRQDMASRGEIPTGGVLAGGMGGASMPSSAAPSTPDTGVTPRAQLGGIAGYLHPPTPEERRAAIISDYNMQRELLGTGGTDAMGAEIARMRANQEDPMQMGFLSGIANLASGKRDARGLAGALGDALASGIGGYSGSNRYNQSNDLKVSDEQLKLLQQEELNKRAGITSAIANENTNRAADQAYNAQVGQDARSQAQIAANAALYGQKQGNGQDALDVKMYTAAMGTAEKARGAAAAAAQKSFLLTPAQKQQAGDDAFNKVVTDYRNQVSALGRMPLGNTAPAATTGFTLDPSKYSLGKK